MENPWNVINCKINLVLNWSANFVILSNTAANKATTFAINNWCRIYVPVVTSLTEEDNAKILQQLKSGFKRTLNCKTYQPKVATQEKNNI